MEDGIERSTINYDCKKPDIETRYIYIFAPINGNYIIFFDKEKAIDYSRKNNCRVDIFIETENSVYNSTKNYYKNGCLEIFSN